MKKVNLFLISLVTLVTLSIGLSSCGDSNQAKENGWNFVKKSLRSPTTATLISFNYGDQIKQILEKSGGNLQKCITVGYFEYDAQNGFGAMVRNECFVFFRNGIPCYMESVESIDNALNRLTNQGYPHHFIPTLNTALAGNGCGCE